MPPNPSECDHCYEAVAMVQAITGIVLHPGGQEAGKVANPRDKDVWVYQCHYCGWRFQTDDEAFNQDSTL